MLLDYTAKNLWSIGHPGLNKKAGKVVSEVTICVPGINHLPDEFWETVKKSKQVERFLDSGRVLIVKDKDPPAATASKAGEARELHGMERKEAERIIKRCLNKPLLERWLQNDTRPFVQFAAQTQLNSLKVVKKKSDE